jgi:peptidoglycan L-alanyl-D-glutamate endopeptidase CwlK
MRHKPSESVIAQLHPLIRGEVKLGMQTVEQTKLTDIHIAVQVNSGYRTFPEQAKLYAQSRTAPGPRVTNSKPGQSYHNYGLAFDFNLVYDLDGNGTYEKVSWDVLKDFDKDGEADWLEVVDVFEVLKYTWGGRFHSIVDDPHLEKTFGHHWTELFALHNAGKIDKDGYVIIH